MFCERCGNLLAGKQTRFCSERCKNQHGTVTRRRALKKKAVEYLGGCCSRCGYGKSLAALQFHHVNGKSFGIAAKGFTRSWDKLKAELDRCILLCANCHAEVEYD